MGIFSNCEHETRYLGNVTIAGGGVLPNIHANLLPKKSQSKASGKKAAASQEY